MRDRRVLLYRGRHGIASLSRMPTSLLVRASLVVRVFGADWHAARRVGGAPHDLRGWPQRVAPGTVAQRPHGGAGEGAGRVRILQEKSPP